MDATIYHNPRCSTSRKALEYLRQRGIEPTVRKYLEDVPSVPELRELISAAGLTVRDAVRTREDVYTELNLSEATDEDLLAAMVAHPRLIQRPFVVTARGTRMARPVDVLDEIIEPM